MNISRLNNFVLITFLLSLVNLAGADKVGAFEARPNSVSHFHNSNKGVSYNNESNSQAETPEFKSKTRARLYSAAFTTIPLALARLNSRGFEVSDQTGTSILLFTPGIIIGPSAGSIYSDDWTLAKRSIIIRSTSAAILVSGYNIRKDDNFEALGLSLLISGGILLISHALYDILFLSAHSVDYYNTRIRMETGFSFYNNMPQEWGQMSHSHHQQKLRQVPSLDIRLFF